MSCSRRIFLGGTVAAVAGCGFAPVYGTRGSAEGLRGSIQVAAPEDRDAFVFVAHLEERLGQPSAAAYDLGYDIAVDEEGVGITPSQETTRYNVLGRVDYEVTDKATGRAVHAGSVEGFTGYSATGSIVGTLAATRDARERLMIALADQIVARLIASVPDWRE